MSLRFLLGILPSGLPEENNQSTHEEINIFKNEIEDHSSILIYSQTPPKFHIGMLTISLLVGIAYGGFTAYRCWMKKNILLGYIRNLVIALACRTFFSIVFDGAILLESPLNVGGGNFLLSIEQICLNLVIAFWLTLNIYLHERVQSNFNNEPNLMIYQLGVPVATVFFVFVWIFTFQDQLPNGVWWIVLNPFSQWIVNSINLLYLLIQLGLLVNIVMAMKKITLDNDGVSLLRKISAMMGVLVLIFWLQFGFSLGRMPLRTSESYLYFFYFIDGLECALICLVLYFFNKWVLPLLNKVSSLISSVEEPAQAPEINETLLNGGRGIVTIDSVLMTRESGKWKDAENGSRDVVYSSVIEPERLKKTLDLYKRLNIIPTTQVTTVEGEEFYDCQLQENSDSRSPAARFGSFTSSLSNSRVFVEDKSTENTKVTEKKQKKNAFYSSKYLIIDSKENDIPRYLETRPSVSSMSGKDSLKSEKINTDYLSDLNTSMTDDLVRKWLDDNSENMQRKKARNEKHQRVPEERRPEIPNGKVSSVSDLELPSRQSKQTEEIPKEKQDETASHKILSTINSVVSSVFFGSKSELRENLEEETDQNKTELCKQIYIKSLENQNIDQLNTTTINTSDETERHSLTATALDKKKANFSEDNLREIDSCSDSDKRELKTKQEVFKPHGNESVPIRTNETTLKDSKSKAELDKSPEHEIQTSPTSEKNESTIQIDFKTRDDTNNECQTPNNLKLLDLEVNITEVQEKEGVVAKKATTPDDSLEALKNGHSLADTISEFQIQPTAKDAQELEPELEKSQKQFITYSDLLEFRSQRDKAATEQPSGVYKKLFEFSDALSSTIGSLISASSSFFIARKPYPDSEEQNEPAITEIENKDEYVEKDFKPSQSEEIIENVTSNTEVEVEKKHIDTNCTEENNVGNNYYEPPASDFILQMPNSELGENTKDLPSELLTPTEFPSTKNQVQPIEENEVTTPVDSDFQKKIRDITNKESNLKKKRKKHEGRRKTCSKKFRSVDQGFTNKINSHLPEYVKTDDKTQGKPFGSNQKTDSNMTEPDVTENSSDSEFSIEKKRDSSSSAGSFSVDQYYSRLMKQNENFNNQLNLAREKQQKKLHI